MNTPEEFFDKLCNTIYDDIFKYIYRLAYDKEIVEDVLQDTFFAVYRDINKIMALSEKEQKAYIFKIAKNCMYKMGNKEYKHHKDMSYLNDEEILVDNDFAERVVNSEYVKSIMAGLKDDEKEMLIQHYFLNVPIYEIALRRNVTVSCMKMKFKRLKERLRTELEA